MIRRRDVLKAALGSTVLFAPTPWAWVWAQSSQDGALKLLKAPKLALVVGNSKYKDAPELKNPANDAKAMAELLKASGFQVTLQLDTGREALVQAIRDYVHAMEKSKAVGLFYFAGHGVQLEWRNYMLPVDAVIDKIDDVAKQSVDVARLMEGLTKAQNPMNIIILDACRENPFGKAKEAQKGLSQMDAPTHTILAYATAPGNVASDGDGANGLYTESFLREANVAEAKIEDVFKRVRLAVRRKTNGQQIPWESTSLEDDFWFQPPKELKKLSDAERAARFAEDAKAWERAKGTGNVQSLEGYLREYPTGSFSEIAQAQLELALAREGEKRIEIAKQTGNPYTKGSATASTNFVVGDRFAYRELDPRSKVERRSFARTVARIENQEVRFDDGFVLDLLGNILAYPDGRTVRGITYLPFEYAVGRRWKSDGTATTPQGALVQVRAEFVVEARETITVPAGTFDAFRVLGGSVTALPTGIIEFRVTHWMAPDKVRAFVAREEFRTQGGREIFGLRSELVSFKQG